MYATRVTGAGRTYRYEINCPPIPFACVNIHLRHVTTRTRRSDCGTCKQRNQILRGRPGGELPEKNRNGIAIRFAALAAHGCGPMNGTSRQQMRAATNATVARRPAAIAIAAT